MYRSACLILMFSIIPAAAISQTAPTDSQTLQGILSEVRQLRHDLQTSNAMLARAQIALYRLQRQAESVEHERQRLDAARLRLAQAESDRSKKAIQIQSAKDATTHSDASDAHASDARTHFEEVVLPELKSELEMLQKQERKAQVEEVEAEQTPSG